MIPAYYAAPVRGADGNEVAGFVKAENVRLGCETAGRIREDYPELDLYVPHEHEEIVGKLWRMGLESELIIEASCEIIAEKDLIIIDYSRGWSEGVKEEYVYASTMGKLIFYFVDYDKEGYLLRGLIDSLSRKDS